MKRTPSTKVDLNHSRIVRVEALDDLAKLCFPGSNKNHQRAFLAIFVEIKWATGGFLPALEPLAAKHGISARTLENVRAKMRRLGIIDHISRFNKVHGYQEGWVLSSRLRTSLEGLGKTYDRLRERKDVNQERKERDLHRYL